MERAAAKLEGVNEVKFNFLTQTLTLDTDENLTSDILQKIADIIKKIEPDCKIKI
jgi:hypothetical protein